MKLIIDGMRVTSEPPDEGEGAVACNVVGSIEGGIGGGGGHHFGHFVEISKISKWLWRWG